MQYLLHSLRLGLQTALGFWHWVLGQAVLQGSFVLTDSVSGQSHVCPLPHCSGSRQSESLTHC